MGNSSSSSGRHHVDDTVDFGYLTPQGVYTGPKDWNQAIVSQLICSRKLAPFYRPLEDYDESWDDDRILAARKPLSDVEGEGASGSTTTRIEPTSSLKSSSANKRPSLQKEPAKPEALIYRGAVECPICFLYYPPNINHSRCCDQAICTECFVQIKRSEPTATHLVSDPAACPYCVQEHFGVVYTPPPWRTGIGSDGTNAPWPDSPKGSVESYPTHKRRQKSFGADSPDVVTIDQIRPDWEAKLAAVRAAVARRANRRIIMRQVGDRLIPVGVTSGRVHALSPEEAAQAEQEAGGSRRNRRRQQTVIPGFEQYVGMGGQDLEELMVMEAMRLSLLEHEEQQRKDAEEKKSKKVEGSSESPSHTDAGPSTQVGGSSSQSRASSSGPASRASSSSKSESKRRSFLSRSRTPSPISPSSSWRKRSSNPPALRAVSGVNSTTSTVLNAPTPESASTPVSGDSPQVESAEVESPRPVEAVQRPTAVHQDTQASSILSIDSTSTHDSYDNLPSSPESVLASQPLLHENGGSYTPTKNTPRDPLPESPSAA